MTQNPKLYRTKITDAVQLLRKRNNGQIVGFVDKQGVEHEMGVPVVDSLADVPAEAVGPVIAEGQLYIIDGDDRTSPGVYTKTTLPAPADFGIGLAYISDFGVGGSLWRCNGSIYLPAGESLLQQSVAQIDCGSGEAAVAMLSSPLIPAGYLKTGAKINVRLRSTRTGTAANLDYKMALASAPDTVSGISLCSDTIRLSSSHLSLGVDLTLAVVSNTQIRQIENTYVSNTPYGTMSSSAWDQLYTVPDLSTNDLYLTLVRLAKTGADEANLLYYEVSLK